MGLAACGLTFAQPAASQEVGVVQGRVLSATGEPLASVRVTVDGASFATLTDAAGRFRLTGVPVGDVSVIARRIGFEEARATATVAAGEAARVELVLKEDAIRLTDLVVSVSREAQRRAETPATVSAVDGEQIRSAGGGHPGEIMRRVPGAWVSVTSGEGHQTAIRQPLTTSPVYLYLEDGVPTRSTGFFNHNALYEINVPQADRIEVSKGPATALYGSDAVGGIVNVGSRAPSVDPSLNVTAEGGAFGWGRLLASASNSWGNKGLRADVNATRSSGWRSGTEYERQSGTLRWDTRLSPVSELRTVATFSRIDQATAGSSAISAEDYRENPTANYTPISYRYVRTFRVSSEYARRGESALFTITPFARWNEMDLLANWTLTTDPTLSTTGHRSAGVLAKFRYDFEPMRTRIIAGADLDFSPGSRLEKALSTTRNGRVFTDYEVLDPVYDYDVTFRAASPYVQLEASPLQRMRLVAGLRYDWMGYEYATRLDPHTVGQHRRPEDATVTYNHLSPKLGATYEVDRALNLFASYGHGFRAPSEGQLFRQGQAVSTVDLQPVKVDSYEAGVRGALGSVFDYDLAVYNMTKYDDVLSYTNPDGSRETVNAGETRHRGIEVGLGMRLGDQLRLDGAYSSAEHTYVAWRPRPDVDLGGNTMEIAPRDIGNASLRFRPRSFRGSEFAAELTHIGSYWMDAENSHRYPGHRLVSLRARVPLMDDVSLFARMMNVANTRFAESSGYTQARGEEFAPGLPRTLYVGATFRGLGR